MNAAHADASLSWLIAEEVRRQMQLVVAEFAHLAHRGVTETVSDTVEAALDKRVAPGEFLTKAEVADRLRANPRTLDHWRRRCPELGFPKPIRLGDRKMVWRASDIDEWLKRRQAQGAEGEGGNA